MDEQIFAIRTVNPPKHLTVWAADIRCRFVPGSPLGIGEPGEDLAG
jgi:hypothetical protein